MEGLSHEHFCDTVRAFLQAKRLCRCGSACDIAENAGRLTFRRVFLSNQGPIVQAFDRALALDEPCTKLHTKRHLSEGRCRNVHPPAKLRAIQDLPHVISRSKFSKLYIYIFEFHLRSFVAVMLNWVLSHGQFSALAMWWAWVLTLGAADRDCWNSVARSFPAPDGRHDVWLEHLKAWRKQHLRT